MENKPAPKANDIPGAERNDIPRTALPTQALPTQTLPTQTPPEWAVLIAAGLQSVRQFVHEAQQGESAYDAAVATSTGLLLKAAFRLDEAIDEALRLTPDPFDRFDGLVRGIDLLLRLMRQIGQRAQAWQRLAEGRQALLQNMVRPGSTASEDTAS